MTMNESHIVLTHFPCLLNGRSRCRLVGETPAFGAWCTDGDDFVFVQFLPNFVRRLLGLTDLLIEWGIARSREMDATGARLNFPGPVRRPSTTSPVAGSCHANR
jgi:hypothetical protein